MWPFVLKVVERLSAASPDQQPSEMEALDTRSEIGGLDIEISSCEGLRGIL